VTSFLERLFHKTIPSDITYEDFLNFRKQNIEEHQYLDYKSREILVGHVGQWIGKDGKLTTDEGFIKLAAVVAGFANAEGGLLIIGIRELREKIHRKIVKKRPGAVYALPDGIITKEMIESKLRALIRFPIDDLTLVPLRSSSRSKHFVCLIDIPQSIRAPHRVNEQDYYQRYNFETRPMLHYQISDLFGKRFAPSLDLQLEIADVSDDEIKLKGILYNFGRAIAKYPMCIWTITNGEYTMTLTGQVLLQRRISIAQYTPGSDTVIYPLIHLQLPELTIRATESNPINGPILLECSICAESTPTQIFNYKIEPLERQVQLTNKSLLQ
jgi:hypothetical protein